MNNKDKYWFLADLFGLWCLAHYKNVVDSGEASATLSDAVTINMWLLYATILLFFGYYIMKPKQWVGKTAKALSALFLIKVGYCLILALFTPEFLMEAMMAAEYENRTGESWADLAGSTMLEEFRMSLTGTAVEAGEIERNWVNIGWIGAFYLGGILGLFLLGKVPPTEDALKARSISKP